MTEVHARELLAVLAATGSTVTLGPAGFAATVTEECRAYLALASDVDAVIGLEAEHRELVRRGSPAAVIYAALLLRRADRDIAALLEGHADDRRPMTIFTGGCTAMSYWLCEAVRWVNGEPWSHPERVLLSCLDRIAKPGWFELPSAKLMAAKAAGLRRDGRAARGRWTFAFLELLEAPDLALVRAGIEALLGSANPAARLYAALLIRRIDRGAGKRALAGIAAAGGTVERPSPGWLRPDRLRRVAIAEVVRELGELARVRLSAHGGSPRAPQVCQLRLLRRRSPVLIIAVASASRGFGAGVGGRSWSGCLR